jgi:hypothetical protein
VSDSFTILNSPLADENARLLSYVGEVGRIIDRLNGAIGRMAQATQNKGVPLWEELQRNWNAHYQQMWTALTQGHAASVGAHEEYINGDNAAARCMM